MLIMSIKYEKKNELEVKKNYTFKYFISPMKITKVKINFQTKDVKRGLQGALIPIERIAI